MLEASGITLHYGSSQVLHGIDLVAKAGEVTCVMGTNGVGKTSLLNALAGTRARSGGQIRLDGRDIGKAPAHALAKQGVAYVPQGRDIFPLLTVRENLETGFSALPREERSVPEEILDLFPVLKKMFSRRGGDLSGGQQQQLAIARALVLRPKLLLLDEPTEGIQPSIIQEIGRVIAHLRDRGGMAIVLVEQYLDFAFDLGDRFTVLERGRVRLAADKGGIAKEELTRATSV